MSGVKHTLRIEDGANSHFFDGRILDQDDECLAFVDIHHPMSAIFAAAPDLFEALRAADAALASVTAFESDARYIMGNTNFALVQQCRDQARAALSKATAQQEGR